MSSSSNRYSGIPNFDLLCGAESGDLERINYALNHGAKINVYHKDTGSTALMIAATGGKLAAVELLLNRGADPDGTMAPNGWTPLHLATQQGHVDVVKALLRGGAKVDSQAIKPELVTPLMVACVEGRLAIVQVLVANGANVDAEDFHSRTPLFMAQGLGNSAVADYLRSLHAARRGCFIASAVYGPDSAEVCLLRQYRDEVLLSSLVGRVFVSIYYAISPPIARFLKHTKPLSIALAFALRPAVGHAGIRLHKHAAVLRNQGTQGPADT